jgi:hypothetical protein
MVKNLSRFCFFLKTLSTGIRADHRRGMDQLLQNFLLIFFLYIFGGLERVGDSFAYVVHFVFLRDVFIRTQRVAVASKRATNLASHLPLNLPGTLSPCFV